MSYFPYFPLSPWDIEDREILSILSLTFIILTNDVVSFKLECPSFHSFCRRQVTSSTPGIQPLTFAVKD